MNKCIEMNKKDLKTINKLNEERRKLVNEINLTALYAINESKKIRLTINCQEKK